MALREIRLSVPLTHAPLFRTTISIEVGIKSSSVGEEVTTSRDAECPDVRSPRGSMGTICRQTPGMNFASDRWNLMIW